MVLLSTFFAWKGAVVRQNPGRGSDSGFEFPELPVEVRVGNQKHIIVGGRRQMDQYSVFMIHGQSPVEDGADECLAISLIGACSETAANASAILLDSEHALKIVR